MDTQTVVIYTDHALTKTTEDQYEICEVNEDCDAIRRTGKSTVPSLFKTLVIHTIVIALARQGKFFDKGYWLVSWNRKGMIVHMKATPLYTKE